jgi:thiol-disulfide isomerase/thioredoxin
MPYSLNSVSENSDMPLFPQSKINTIIALLLTLLIAVICILFLAHAAPLWAAPTPSTQPVLSLNNSSGFQSFRFPSLQLSYLQHKLITTKRRSISKVQWGRVHLSQLIGKRPFLIFYFAVGDAHSERELIAFAKAATQWHKQIACFAATRTHNRQSLQNLQRLLQKLKIDLPVITDSKGVLAYATLARRLPSYALIDQLGQLRLIQASALDELVTPFYTLTQILQKVAQGQDIPNIRAPGYHPNPFALISKLIPHIVAKSLETKSQPFVLQNHISQENRRPIILLFWSISCEHCRKLLPELHKLLQHNNLQWRLFSFTHAPSPKIHNQITQFLQKHAPKLSAFELSSQLLFEQLHVKSYPCFVLLDPSGYVRAIHIGAQTSPAKIIADLLQKLTSQNK